MKTIDRLDGGRFTRLARAMSGKDVTVVLSGGACCTDGDTITIPANADYMEGEDAEVLHGMLDHEVAHVFEEQRAKRLGFKTPLEYVKGAKLNVERMLFNVFEDVRIERVQGERWPGAAENLRAAGRHSVKMWREKSEKRDEGATMTPAQEWHELGCAVIFAAQDLPTDWATPSVVEKMKVIENEVRDARFTSEPAECWDLVQRVLAKLTSPPPEEDAAVAPDLIKVVAVAVENSASSDARKHGRWFPTRRALAGDRTFVPESVITSDAYNALLDKVAPQVSSMRSKLSAILRARSQRHMVGDAERGVLDTSSLYAVRTGERRVFARRSDADQADAAVMVLVDQSASMGSGEGSKSYFSMLSSIAICETMSSLQVPCEVVGFTNVYADVLGSVDFPVDEERSTCTRYLPFEYRVFKGFDEPARAARGRWGDMRGISENVDGEAVLYVARRLAVRPEKRKLLFVLSDGAPVGGCVDDDVQRQYLVDVVKRVVNSGIEVCAIGVMTESPRRYYGPPHNAASCEVVNNISNLAATVFAAVKSSLLASGRRAA